MPQLDELRVKRDRAKVRLDVALAMEHEALERFSGNSTGYAAWKLTTEAANDARRSFEAAQAAYLECLKHLAL